MVRLSGLVDAVAEVTGVVHNNVTLHARLAREAGFIQQGGRGLSAPEMTARDAAMLLGALVASPTAKETSSTLNLITNKNSRITEINSKSFGELADTAIEVNTNHGGSGASTSTNIPHSLLFLSRSHSFIDAIEEFILNENKITQILGDQGVIEFNHSSYPVIWISHPWMEMTPTTISIQYGPHFSFQYTGDLQTTRQFGWKTIKAVSRVLQ